MSSIADHKRRIKEHLEELQDALNVGLEKRPASVGFHASACACEILEMYMHLANLISTGKKVNHIWFKRPKEEQKIEPLIERKMPVSFPGKEDVYELIYTIEDHRDNLIYGKPAKGEVEIVFRAFQRLKAILESKIAERGDSIE
ncbi:MAG: hypothetical protein HYW25_04630 [Candidatus Aenigmarchaeota archaeon]|nr:hypothetical protein [Candidatus Aenigmarchaeota archaeon]